MKFTLLRNTLLGSLLSLSTLSAHALLIETNYAYGGGYQQSTESPTINEREDFNEPTSLEWVNEFSQAHFNVANTGLPAFSLTYNSSGTPLDSVDTWAWVSQTTTITNDTNEDMHLSFDLLIGAGSLISSTANLYFHNGFLMSTLGISLSQGNQNLFESVESIRDNGTSGHSFEPNRDADTQEAYPTLGDFDISGDAYESNNPKTVNYHWDDIYKTFDLGTLRAGESMSLEYSLYANVFAYFGWDECMEYNSSTCIRSASINFYDASALDVFNESAFKVTVLDGKDVEVPEPSSLMLLLGLLAGLVVKRRR